MTQVTDDPRHDRAARTDVARSTETGSAETVVSPPLDNGAWLRQRISRTWAAGMGAAWYALYVIAVLVEPTTHHEEPVIAVALSYAMLGGLFVMAAGLITRRRWGLVASLATAGLFTALAVACPTTGHHAIGAWWFVQLACAGGLVAGSVVALRRA
jgi:hypothetical protein